MCPICRAAFADVLPVPPADSDPEGWFKVRARRRRLPSDGLTPALNSSCRP